MNFDTLPDTATSTGVLEGFYTVNRKKEREMEQILKNESGATLKPCPFCGSPAEFDYEGEDGLGAVQCTNRKCSVRIFDDRDSAIEKWNRREPSNAEITGSEAVRVD